MLPQIFQIAGIDRWDIMRMSIIPPNVCLAVLSRLPIFPIRLTFAAPSFADFRLRALEQHLCIRSSPSCASFKEAYSNGLGEGPIYSFLAPYWVDYRSCRPGLFFIFPGGQTRAPFNRASEIPVPKVMTMRPFPATVQRLSLAPSPSGSPALGSTTALPWSIGSTPARVPIPPRPPTRPPISITQLDLGISGFLALLVMEAPTGKVMEWDGGSGALINEFNVEPIPALFSPYRESPHFAKMLWILHMRPNSVSSFLLPFKAAAQIALPVSLVTEMLKNSDATVHREPSSNRDPSKLLISLVPKPSTRKPSHTWSQRSLSARTSSRTPLNSLGSNPQMVPEIFDLKSLARPLNIVQTCASKPAFWECGTFQRVSGLTMQLRLGMTCNSFLMLRYFRANGKEHSRSRSYASMIRDLHIPRLSLPKKDDPGAQNFARGTQISGIRSDERRFTGLTLEAMFSPQAQLSTSNPSRRPRDYHSRHLFESIPDNVGGQWGVERLQSPQSIYSSARRSRTSPQSPTIRANAYSHGPRIGDTE
ncbi:hypothetical protein B0H14DRAFT_2563449 [Mycena olivaceomarginata]|nr:hypothetical protein B0H14DRAFT_2563449 [Mycena olivaceomarginata]